MNELIINAVIAIGGVKIAPELLLKLLGPSFEYVGNIPPRVAEFGLNKIKEIEIKNLANVFKKAERKMETNGTVNLETNLRVVREVVQQGIYAQDEVMIEYFAGILASSKTENGTDDTCIPYLQTIKTLTSFDLKLHCFLYKTIFNMYSKDNFRLAQNEHRSLMKTHIGVENFINNMKITIKDFDYILESIFRLAQNGLIENEWNFGNDKNVLQKLESNIKMPGLTFKPTALGAKMFMSAYGFGCKSIELFFELEYKDDLEINFASEAYRMNKKDSSV